MVNELFRYTLSRVGGGEGSSEDAMPMLSTIWTTYKNYLTSFGWISWACPDQACFQLHSIHFVFYLEYFMIAYHIIINNPT